MQLNLTDLSPWADVHRVLTSMKSLAVKVGDYTYSGDAELTLDDEGNATISLPERKRKKVK